MRHPRLLLLPLLSGFFALLSAQSFACTLLDSPYSATYSGSYNGWRLTAVQEYKPVKNTEKQWQLSMHADSLIGSVHESSIFTITDDSRIKSREYRSERKILFHSKEQNTHFNWKRMTAHAEGEDQGEIKLQGSEFDYLNYQLQLRCDVQRNIDTMNYPVVVQDHRKIMQFKILGTEKLKTKLGEVKTILVKRIRDDDERITKLWLAPKYNYLMVKLLQEEKQDAQAYLLYLEGFSD